MKLTSALLLAAAAMLPGAALANSDEDQGPAAAAQANAPLPTILTAAQRNAYRDIFAAIRAQDWAGAAAKIDGMDEGPLHNAARARLYLAPNSPRIELPPLLSLLQRAPEMPQAEQIARLARTRGAIDLPALPTANRFATQPGQPRRSRPRPIEKDEVSQALETLIQPLIVQDQPAAAEALLLERGTELAADVRTEFQQRTAWSHYLVGNDAAARGLADQARLGQGEWVIHAEWTFALAAWRQGDCAAAGAAFANVGARSTDQELSAAGHYWASRADMACRHPERVQARLRSAARMGETFYGMLAARALGLRASTIPGSGSLARADWHAVTDERNVRTALALIEVGEREEADTYLRHQARLGNPREHEALIRLAERLNLTGTQMWLAYNAPRGTAVDPLARYPLPDWRPPRGFRVDRALVFGHALQESIFRPSVVSPAGAVGLMQVRPGTASDVARWRGESSAGINLADPGTNLEFGQSYLEYLRDLPSTNGLMPKVMAAYNAGPAPIAEWNNRGFDRGDPLLYIESIPYWETRGYLPIVFRNYWVYEQRIGQSGSSRAALVQGLWPRYPGLQGPNAIRIEPPGRR